MMYTFSDVLLKMQSIVKFTWQHGFFSRFRRLPFFRVIWTLLFIIGTSLTIAVHSTPTVASPVELEHKLIETVSTIVSLDGKWKFAAGYLWPAKAYLPTFDDRDWRSLSIPSN